MSSGETVEQKQKKNYFHLSLNRIIPVQELREMTEKRKRPREENEEDREFQMPSSKKARSGKKNMKFKKHK